MMQRWVLEKFGYPGIHSRLVHIGCDVSLEHVTTALNGECDMDPDLARALCDVLDLEWDELRDFAVAYMYRHDPSCRAARLSTAQENQVGASTDREA